MTALILAGCNETGDGGAQETASLESHPTAQDQPVNVGGGAPAGAPGISADQVSEALRALLPGSATIRLLALRRGVDGAACGEVERPGFNEGEARGHPFVVTPDGAAAISQTPGISLDNVGDGFPDLYIRWCASPEELRAFQLETNVYAQLPRDPLVLPDAVDLPAPAMETRRSAPPERVGEANQAPVDATAPTKSFSEAVIRPSDR